MSASYDPVIDPALRDVPPPSRGMKRKAATNSRKAAAPPPTAGGRVTRRSAQAKEVAAQPSSSAEPARGEEENLNRYGTDRDSSSKRSRRQSPEHDRADWSHPGPLGGIENLAAAAAFQSDPSTSTPIPKSYPYPFGLTPYRYPCLTPHLPEPPAGDPSNSNFRPFDPVEAESYHQSLVENNQTYSTLASLLDDGKEKA